MIYVRAVMELLRSEIPVHGLAHITGGGLLNLLRLGATWGSRSPSRCPCPPCSSDRPSSETSSGRDVGGVQHGLRLLRRGRREADAATRRRAAPGPPPGDGRDRSLTDRAGRVRVPSLAHRGRVRPDPVGVSARRRAIAEKNLARALPEHPRVSHNKALVAITDTPFAHEHPRRHQSERPLPLGGADRRPAACRPCTGRSTRRSSARWRSS